MAKTSEFLKESWRIVAVSGFIVLAINYGIIGADRYLSSYRFCTSCHSMDSPDKELRRSKHWGILGVNPECKDCHLHPEPLRRAKSHIVDGMRGFIGEFTHDLSTEEKFDVYRPEFAHTARVHLKEWNGSTCRRCHKDSRPDTKEGIASHNRMKSEDVTCIDCHQNLVHKKVPEEDIAEGIKAGKIVLKKQ